MEETRITQANLYEFENWMRLEEKSNATVEKYRSIVK